MTTKVKSLSPGLLAKLKPPFHIFDGTIRDGAWYGRRHIGDINGAGLLVEEDDELAAFIVDLLNAALAPAAPAVTDEPGQGSGSEGVAAGRAGDQVTS